MKVKLTSEQKRAIFFWIVVILISPIAVEAIFLADLLGAELAIGFLWYYLKNMVITWEARWISFKMDFRTTLQLISTHGAASPKFFATHYLLSCIILTVSGSLLYMIVIWYPIMIFGGRMSGYL